jgi:hypothetical protein
VAVLSLLALAVTAAQATGVVGAVVPLPAAVEAVKFPTAEQSFRTFAADGTPLAATPFRVVSNSGNCCENYLTTTPLGQLIDFGGTYIHMSNDDGKTWQRVKPTTPLVNGEGTVAVAPNGDILGVGWDPYTGDHLQSFKYEAATDRWTWAEQPLHTPFYDREWIAIVPGPIEVGGTTYPYVSVLRGGYPSKDIYQISTDGLTYTSLSSKQIDTPLKGTLTEALAPVVSSHSDYGQTITNTNIAPMGERAIISGPELLTGLPPASSCSTRTWLAQADLRWGCYKPAEGPAVEWHAVDSSARLHATTWSPSGTVTYLTSADGGRTVQELDVPLPAGYQVLSDGHRDLKANAAAGVVAITAHAQDMSSRTSQDFVFIYRYGPDAPPVLDRYYRIGLGDLNSGVGVSSTAPRFDFSTVAILPDGRVAASFNDSKHKSPAVAVQLPASSN